MIKTELFKIDGLRLISPAKFGDHRGFFSETYNKRGLTEIGLVEEFVQDNHSLSASKGVVRGLHFQTNPHAQGKLVRVIKGAIFDVAVDLRKSSMTFGQHVAVTLSAENWQQFWIPAGFAHGFCTLEANTEVIYKTTGYYAPDHDAGLAWNDPEIGINWPVNESDAILSDKDCGLVSLNEFPEEQLFD